LFINPDAVLQPGSIAAMIDAERGRRRPLIVGGRVVGLDGREQRGGRRDTLTPWSAFREFTGLTRLGRWFSGFGSMHHEDKELPEEPISVGAVSGAFMLIRADDFRELGGFDGDYFVHVEDLDICRRAWETGGAVVFAPKAWVRHEGATSPASAVRVAWFKGKGFANYFRKFAKTDRDRLIARASAPFIVAAAVLQGFARSLVSPRKQRAPTPYESFRE
jgi:GT2 family glycosyltransferase